MSKNDEKMLEETVNELEKETEQEETTELAEPEKKSLIQKVKESVSTYMNTPTTPKERLASLGKKVLIGGAAVGTVLAVVKVATGKSSDEDCGVDYDEDAEFREFGDVTDNNDSE